MSVLPPFQRVDKQALARRFGAAAQRYDAHAAFQREVGETLLTWLPAEGGDWLDLGCGTGHFLPALGARSRTLLGLDLAPGMLAEAARRPGGARLLCGDAEALPLGDGALDLIFSSLALQWCERPQQAFAEACRVLRPGGRLYLATLLAGSLHELKHAWLGVDATPRVNRFLERAALAQAITAGGLIIDRLEEQQWQLSYETVGDLLRDLKGIGASQLNDGWRGGLGGRARLAALAHQYEPFRTGAGLPASYRVCLACLRRPTE